MKIRPTQTLYAILSFAFILMMEAGHLSAQVPSLLEYDGFMTGNITGNRTIGVRLYSASTNGTLLYRENVGTVKVTQGQFYFQYGQNGMAGNSTTPTTLAATLTDSQQWLVLTVNGIEQSLRERLVAVPFALKAKQSEDAQRLTQNVTALSGNMTALTSRHNGLTANVTALGTQVSTLSDDLTYHVVDLSTGLMNLTSRHNGLSANVTTLGTQVNTLNGNVTTLANGQNALTANVTTLANGQNALTANVTTLRTQVNALSGNVTTLANRQSALTANVTALESTIQALRDELAMVGAAKMVTVLGGTLPASSELGNQTVASFQIGKYEVTWGEWREVREWAVSHGYTDLAGVGDTHPWGRGDSFPVVRVSFYDVVKWCNAKSVKEGKTPVYTVDGTTYKVGERAPTVVVGANGYRLPSEKEWEWAARGGLQTRGYRYSGSNDFNAVAWVNISTEECKAVGGKMGNELGIYDMSGNVMEWCNDVVNPSYRRVRGGSWFFGGDYAAVASRGINGIPDIRDEEFGFRLARSSGN